MNCLRDSSIDVRVGRTRCRGIRPERSDGWTTARPDARAVVKGLQGRGGKLVRDRASYAAMSAAVLLPSLASVVYTRGVVRPVPDGTYPGRVAEHVAERGRGGADG